MKGGRDGSAGMSRGTYDRPRAASEWRVALRLPMTTPLHPSRSRATRVARGAGRYSTWIVTLATAGLLHTAPSVVSAEPCASDGSTPPSSSPTIPPKTIPADPRTAPPEKEDESAKFPPLKAVIETSRGTITVDLGVNYVPRLVVHFANLADRKFYDGLTFHSTSAGVQVHTGDPTATGEGGCGYTLSKQFNRHMLYEDAGVLGLWSTGPQVSSQFFITLAPNPRKYDLSIPGIGRVVEGLDVAQRLQRDDVVTSVRIEGDQTRLREAFADDLAKWNRILDREAAKPKVESKDAPTKAPPPRKPATRPSR